MTKFNSLARARVIGPEGGAWGGGASGGAREGAAGVDVLVVSSSGSNGADRVHSFKNSDATSWHELMRTPRVRLHQQHLL